MEVARLIQTVTSVVTLLIIVDVIASWIPSLNESQFIGQVRRLTDPILAPFRRLIPAERIGFDLSPIAAIFAIRFLERLLIGMVL